MKEHNDTTFQSIDTVTHGVGTRGKSALRLLRTLIRRGTADVLCRPGRGSASPEYESIYDASRHVIRRAFESDESRFEHFVGELYEGLPTGVTALLRGSALTGQRWRSGEPFDADGPGSSDIDILLIGRGALELWNPAAMYLPRLYSWPVDDETPDSAPSLRELRRKLSSIACRAVTFQASVRAIQSVREVLLKQPALTLVRIR